LRSTLPIHRITLPDGRGVAGYSLRRHLAIFKVERFVKDWRKVLTPEQLARIPQVIPRGEMVRVVIAAAECDPERFPDPDALDITRTANRHLALGKGIHHCLGALLARMEGQIAIGTLLRRMPGFHVRGGRRVRSVLTVMYLTMPTRRLAAARGRRRIRPRVPRPVPPSGRLCSLARFCGDDLPRNLSLEPAKFAQ
jgi:hypothetical protein